MSWLKQSTAVTVMIGPFVDDTDGKTAETGLTISQADVRLSKNGGNMAQKNEASAATHDEIGVYGCPLDATDTGTLGRLDLFVHETGALPVFNSYMVLPANVWDSLFGADALQVHAVEITNNLITAAALATDAVTEIQSGLATAAALTTVDNLVDDLEGRLTAARAGYLDNLNSGVTLSSTGVDGVIDEVVEGTITLRQAIRLLLAGVTGKANGGGTTTVNFRDIADSKNRLTMTVDADGNRTAVTRDAT